MNTQNNIPRERKAFSVMSLFAGIRPAASIWPPNGWDGKAA
ncbi:hypothetical protein [Fibrisoma montanum]|nr:hypothetical protein [Fibrisoma montanum]